MLNLATTTTPALSTGASNTLDERTIARQKSTLYHGLFVKALDEGRWADADLYREQEFAFANASELEA